MTHFNHEVTDVIVEHIARDACALRLPIHPHAQRAVVDVIVGNDRIQCGMEFDASDLPSEEFTLQRNVMDMVMLDTAECAAHMSDDGILAALVDVVIAYDMTADQPLFPTDATGLEHSLQLVLVAGLAFGFRPLVVAGRDFLAQRHRREFGVMQYVVFDNPAIRPVRTDHAPLLRGRRRPITGGLRHFKTAHSDVVDMVAGREEARTTNADFHQFRIRIGTLEICPDRCGAGMLVHFGMPHITGTVRIRHRAGNLQREILIRVTRSRVVYTFQCRRFEEGNTVEIHIAKMFVRLLAELGHFQPIAENRGREWIEIAEHRVVKRHRPHMRMIGQFRPTLHTFRAFDNRPCFTLGPAIGDAFMFAQTTVLRINLFAVYAFMHDHRVARSSHLRGLGNRGERMLRVATRGIAAGWFDMVFKRHC